MIVYIENSKESLKIKESKRKKIPELIEFSEVAEHYINM